MKKTSLLLLLTAAVIALCVVDLRCRGGFAPAPSVVRMKNEIAEGKRAMRQQEAENLARAARSLRVLAKRYKANGENKKAQRAIGAAQELDRKIAQLLSEP